MAFTTSWDLNDTLSHSNITTTIINVTATTECETLGKRTPDSYLSVGFLMAGVFLARFGVWVADLTITQIFLEKVIPTQRGIVNGVQSSINQLMDLLKYALVVVLPDTETFGFLILLSFWSISTAWLLYGVFLRREGVPLCARCGSEVTVVCDERSEIEEAGEEPSEAEDARDGRSGKGEVCGERFGAQEVYHKRSGAQEVCDKRSVEVNVREKRSAAVDVRDKRSGAVDVREKRSAAERGHDKLSRKDEACGRRSGAEESCGQRSGVREGRDKGSGAVEACGEPSGVYEVRDERSGGEKARDERSGVKEVATNALLVTSVREPLPDRVVRFSADPLGIEGLSDNV